MSMEYRVISVKQPKANKICVLETEEGKQLEDVFISPKFNDGRVSFSQIVEGSMVLGSITPSDYNGKTYHWLNHDEPKGSLKPQYRQGKQQAVAAAMERKEQSIEKFQGSKEMGIKVSSTARDATLILTAMRNEPNVDWKKEWLSIRKWLWDNFENVANDNYPMPDGDVPF